MNNCELGDRPSDAITEQNKEMARYSEKYLQAIAHLSQEIYDSGYFLVNSESINWDDPWMQFCENSVLKSACNRVEAALDYQLSWSQCCNAIKWIFAYSPDAWSHLL